MNCNLLKIKILFVNVKGIKWHGKEAQFKIDRLKCIIAQSKANIVVLTETHGNNETMTALSNGLHNLEWGFNQATQEDPWAGVTIRVDTTAEKWKISFKKTIQGRLMEAVIKTKDMKEEFSVYRVYTDSNNLIESWEEILSKIRKTKPTVIVEDYNTTFDETQHSKKKTNTA